MKKWKKGDVIRAEDMNAIMDEAMRLGKISTDSSLEVLKLPSGIHFRIPYEKPMWTKITSGSNPYAWKEQKPKAGGLFEDFPGGRTGTTTQDPAYEMTSNTSVAANVIVRMERSYTTGEWMFTYGSC